jgi:hypothetical protein
VKPGADRARVAAYLSLIVTDEGVTVTKSAGAYDTEVVLDQGGWRFRSVVLDLDSPFRGRKPGSTACSSPSTT